MIDIGNERKGVIIGPTDIQRIMREYHEQLCTH